MLQKMRKKVDDIGKDDMGNDVSWELRYSRDGY